VTDNAPQGFAYHYPNLFLLMRRKHVEQSIKRAGRAAGMQCCQNKVAGLSRSDCERDRFQIAHFSDHDYVRIFAERSTQCCGERVAESENLSLGNVTVFLP